jgi:replication factor C subunit 1
MSLPSGSVVSLCGDFDNRPSLLSFLSSRGYVVVSWASNINALIVGDGAMGRWKFLQASAIPKIPVADILASASAGAQLWVDRYAPSKLTDIIGQTAAIAELQTWLRDWSPSGKGPRGALVTGPPGIGKTTAVHLVVAACKYDVVEFNASDERSASSVHRFFDDAKRSGHCGRRRVVVMDEVDGMSQGDRGGVGALAQIIASSSFPIICISNERGTPKLRPLAACCADIRFTRPNKATITKALMTRIVRSEKLTYSYDDVETLCERNGNDIRSLVNALQFQATTMGAKDALLRMDAFSAAGRVLGSSESLDMKTDLVFLDYGMIPLMIAEGYIATCDRPRAGVQKQDEVSRLGRCCVAGSYLGLYDILDRRIHTTQIWAALPYAVSVVASVALVCEGVAPFNIFPSWLGKQSKRLKHRRWINDIRSRLRCGSGEDILDRMDTLRCRLFKKDRSAGTIVSDLVLYKLNRDDMLETLVDLTYKGDEARVAMDTKVKSAVTREWNKIDMGQVVKATNEDDISVMSDDEYAYDDV